MEAATQHFMLQAMDRANRIRNSTTELDKDISNSRKLSSESIVSGLLDPEPAELQADGKHDVVRDFFAEEDESAMLEQSEPLAPAVRGSLQAALLVTTTNFSTPLRQLPTAQYGEHASQQYPGLLLDQPEPSTSGL